MARKGAADSLPGTPPLEQTPFQILFSLLLGVSAARVKSSLCPEILSLGNLLFLPEE